MLDSDEVLVPGLGVFRAEIVPASFSDKGFTVNPPYRKLVFAAGIPDQVVDDKAGKVVEGEGLAELVESVKAELKETRSVELPGLGKLRLTKSDQYFFVPDEDANIFPDGFGLEPVSLKNKEGGARPDKKAGAKKGVAKKGAETQPDKENIDGIKAIWIIVGIIILAMIVLRLLGTFVPDFIDKLLYTPEELAIIHRGL